MSTKGHAVLLVTLLGCAKGNSGADVDAAVDGVMHDTGCGELCDQDHDGVVDGNDACPNSSSISTVNHVGCAESQLTAMLVPFPPFGLTWTPTGDLGRAGGLTWTYVGIDRGDLFHIDWIICDDPATPCGLSLDGAIDAPAENWQFSAASSDLAMGKIVFTNTTHINLEDATNPQLNGRLTVTLTYGAAAVPGGDVAALYVTPRVGAVGAEITGTSFTAVILAEVQDPMSSAWAPYLDYYDAAPTPTNGGSVAVSFGGSFYAK